MHGKQYGKVDYQAPPYEEVIDDCPVVCVESNLGTDTCTINRAFNYLINTDFVCLCPYLNSHDNDQGCCYGNSKHMLVRNVGAVLFHHDREGSVGNEEEQG